MAKRLFIGGLPYSTTSDELREVFAQVGTVVECTVVTDRYSGQSKGFAFVEMSTDKEADEAVQKLNGTPFGGRTLVVNEARPREERPSQDGGRRFDNRGRGGFDNRGGGRDRGRDSGRGGHDRRGRN